MLTRRPGDLLREREELLRAYPPLSLWSNNIRGTAYQLLDLTYDVDEDVTNVTYTSYSVAFERGGELHFSTTLENFLTRFTRRD